MSKKKEELFFLIEYGEFKGCNYLDQHSIEHFLLRTRKDAVILLKEKLHMNYCFNRRMWIDGVFGGKNGANLISLPCYDKNTPKPLTHKAPTL